MFILVPNLPPGIKEKNTHKCIMALNSRGLFARGTTSLYSFFFLPPGNCPLRCSLFLRFLNLPAGAACFTVSEPTFKRLLARPAACIYGFGTYLKGPSINGAACL